MTRIYDEWADGWHRADSEDLGAASSPQDHPDWPPEVRRGYGDWWTHPQGHEKRVMDRDYQQYAGAALRPDPPIGTKEAL